MISEEDSMAESTKSGTRRRGKSAARDKGTSEFTHRLKRLREHGLKPQISGHGDESDRMKRDFALDCGWGRLVFAQTFSNEEAMVGSLQKEGAEQRDIAVYVRDPHVLLANAPQEVFLDPSHTYRLHLNAYRPAKRPPAGFFIRRLTSQEDAIAINRIYATRGMVPVPPDFFWERRDARAITYFVAEDELTGDVLGTVTGIDHYRAFNDPERGASMWCLAVDPQARQPGIGEALTRRLAEYYTTRASAFLDLSVMHDNEQAIALYEKLGFERVSYFSVKRKNTINETLFTAPEIDEHLNPYAMIIVREARRRGIHVTVTDAEGGFFRLTYGGRSIHCRESLSELTSAIALSICDDKAVTRRIVAAAGVTVPEQIVADAEDDALDAFLARHGSVVVKPARGEQGKGVAIGLSNRGEIGNAVAQARRISDAVLIEQCVEGRDLRLIVINYKLVAAALRKPPTIFGDGRKTVRDLISAQSRRRAAATGGESTIPIDAETERTIADAGFDLESIIPADRPLQVRKTANLHTGGTIHDVTDEIHPELVKAAVKCAQAIEIPVTGIDFMVKSHRRADYFFIEANERPGLANHEPQPTAERFIDLLFPLSLPTPVRRSRQAPQASVS
jgi:GNAT-family acetyltransferase (TIGR03103 family)